MPTGTIAGEVLKAYSMAVIGFPDFLFFLRHRIGSGAIPMRRCNAGPRVI